MLKALKTIIAESGEWNYTLDFSVEKYFKLKTPFNTPLFIQEVILTYNGLLFKNISTIQSITGFNFWLFLQILNIYISMFNYSIET